MLARMSQRGITGELVELVRQFGRDEDDAYILNRQDLRSLLEQLRSLERVAVKALDKGGLVVVASGSALITTYNYGSSNKRHRHDR